MIQIITNRKHHFEGWSDVKVSPYSTPMAFDSYCVNLVDLSDEDVWINNGPTSEKINIKSDLKSLYGIINASKKAECIIVLPQNYTYRYGSSSRTPVKLKDMLDSVRKNILEPLIPLTEYTYALAYENNITHIGNIDYTSAFYFMNEREPLTSAKDSNKATTIKRRDRVYLTTLDIFGSEEKLYGFLRNTSLLPQERSQYPEWLTQMPMFDDLELMKGVKACEIAIQELEHKKETYGFGLIENLKYKSILCTNGKELVSDVFRILEQILACDLSGFVDKNKEDFLIELEKVVLVGEIKGVTTNVKSEHISQVEVHYQGYLDEQQEIGINRQAKPILIMNPFKNKPLDQREPVHEIQLKLARRNNCLIIETITLLKIFERFCKNELTTEQIIDKIVNTSGLLKIEDFNDVMEEKENEV